jgi:hypothetical protein
MTDDDFSPALAKGPDAILALIAERLKAGPGCDLFTVLVPHASGTRLDRLYSTNHRQYPLGAADEVKDDPWFRRLFDEKQPIVANTMEEIGTWIPDYSIFIEQNYFSLLNLPVIFAGETIGLINIMGGPHHFDATVLAQIRNAVPIVALAILGSTCKPPRIGLPMRNG